MISKRIQQLRKQMQAEKVHAFIVPSTDAHQSEYLPECWKRRPWISGFTGSAGDVVITLKKGGLWTDGRYFAQATDQLKGSGIDLYKLGVAGTPSVTEFLRSNLKSGQKFAVDPKTISHAQALNLEKELSPSGITVKYLKENLVDRIWKDQPGLPNTPVRVHEIKFAGETVNSKLKRVRTEMQKANTTVHVITMLDAIAWLYNLRGNDVSFNPVFIAYAVVTMDMAMLFIDSAKVTKGVRKHLGKSVKIFDYSDFKSQLKEIAQSKAMVWIDNSSTNHWIVSILQKSCNFYNALSPVVRFKAIKNDAEIAGYKACQVRDGAAMANFLCWLETAVPKGGVTELSATKKLEEFRAQQDMFVGPSFESISSYKIHGAIIHYAVTEESDIPLQADGSYLIDSGGQYRDGTTDITRTVALGETSAEEKDRFTRVLIGHIDLAMTSFPRGTTGPALDTISRQALWKVGLNFNHGTGHGIGAHLCVHEGPQSINPTKAFSVPLGIGMICSNEPGYYKEKEFGMRTENLINVVRDDEKSNDEFEFYKFETTTLCPIDTRLVDTSLMTPAQIKWLNKYHKRVREEILPLVKGRVKVWLRQVTRAIRK